MRRSVWQGTYSWACAAAQARDESGQTMAEYAVLLGVLVIGVAGAVTLLATGINQKLQSDLVAILSGM